MIDLSNALAKAGNIQIFFLFSSNALITFPSIELIYNSVDDGIKYQVLK